MNARAAFLALALALPGAGAAAQAPPRGLTTAAVDTGLYRDGEVRRRNERFGGWSLDCDEIVRLSRRFCSLRSLAFDGEGRALARLTVSTNDDGHPAALLDLPLGVDLARPVEVRPDGGLVLEGPSAALVPAARRVLEAAARDNAPADKGAEGKAGKDKAGKDKAGRKKGPAETAVLRASLAVALCDAAGCHAVWPLSPVDIAALRAGAGVQISFATLPRPPLHLEVRAGPALARHTATIGARGFEEAVQASLR